MSCNDQALFIPSNALVGHYIVLIKYLNIGMQLLDSSRTSFKRILNHCVWIFMKNGLALLQIDPFQNDWSQNTDKPISRYYMILMQLWNLCE